MSKSHASSSATSTASLGLKPPERGEQQTRYESTPSYVCDYGRTSYWDERYLKAETPFEWYYPYSAFSALLAEYVRRDDVILIMGCGSSPFPIDMYDDGYNRIVCADVSRVVIDQQKEKYADYPVQWYAVNMIECLFEDEQFNVIIDKACLDAIFCSDLGEKAVRKTLQEVDRILVPDGVYLLISRGLPEERLELLEVEKPEDDDFLAWRADVHAIVKPAVDPNAIPDYSDPTNVYYVYACEKDVALVAGKKRAKAKKEAAEKGTLKRRRGRGRGRGRTGRGR